MNGNRKSEETDELGHINEPGLSRLVSIFFFLNPNRSQKYILQREHSNFVCARRKNQENVLVISNSISSRNIELMK